MPAVPAASCQCWQGLCFINSNRPDAVCGTVECAARSLRILTRAERPPCNLEKRAAQFAQTAFLQKGKPGALEL